jgi:hypothetical protein
VIPIELSSSKIGDSNACREYKKEWKRRWRQRESVPSRMIDVGWDIQRAAVEAISLIHYMAAQLSGNAGINLKASAGDEQVLNAVRNRLAPIDTKGDT